MERIYIFKSLCGHRGKQVHVEANDGGRRVKRMKKYIAIWALCGASVQGSVWIVVRMASVKQSDVTKREENIRFRHD